MIPFALTVVVALELDDDTAMRNTLRDTIARSLDRDVVVQMILVDEPRDETLKIAGTSRDAVAVVSVHWSENHHKASLRVYRVSEARFVERTIEFNSGDAEAERTRAVGLSFVSMLPENVRPATPEVAPRPREEDVQPNTAPRVLINPPPHSEGPSDSPSFRRSIAVGASSMASWGLGEGGYGGGLGGTVTVNWYLSDRISLRADLGARVGQVESAKANSTLFVGGFGLSVETPSGHRFGADGRLSAVLIRQTLTHFSGDEISPDSQSTFQLGALAGADGLLFLSPRFAVTVGVGAEIAFGENQVFYKGAQVALIPPVRPFATFGFRGYF